MDIIGRNSPIIQSLEVSETAVLPSSNNETHPLDPATPSTSKRPFSSIENIDSKRHNSVTPSRSKIIDAEEANFLKEFREKKLKKLDLEIENLELRNVLLRRQVASQYTAPDPGMLFTDSLGNIIQSL